MIHVMNKLQSLSQLLRTNSKHAIFSNEKRYKCFKANNIIEPFKLAFNSYENTTSTETAGPPLIILHGLFGSKQNWRSISRTINAETSPKRKVIAVDIRNHGESPHSPEHSYEHIAEDIAYLLQELNIPRAAILGHSMGGRAAMFFALKYPNLAERIIVVDISPVTTSRNLLDLGVVFHGMRTINVPSELSMKEGRLNVIQHLEKFIKDRSIIEFVLLNLRKTKDGEFVWQVNIEGLFRNFYNITNFSIKQFISTPYLRPSLFIAGKKSDYVQKSDLPKIKRFFPDSKLIWLDTGHLVHIERTTEFISRVVEFLNDTHQKFI